MDWFSFLVAGIMVYVSVGVFFLGIGFQVYRWQKAPKSPVKQGIFPKPVKAGTRWLKLVKDALVFPQVREVDPWMWISTLLFHLALLAAFVGHLRMIHEFTPLVTLLGSEGLNKFAAWSGGIVGIILLFTLLYFLIRRFKSPFKDISTPEDFLLLIVILCAVGMGDHLRFSGAVHMSDYQAYVQSLLAFDPRFPPALEDSSSKWTLIWHVFFANLLFIWFPFSKFMHVIGSFATNLTRGE